MLIRNINGVLSVGFAYREALNNLLRSSPSSSHARNHDFISELGRRSGSTTPPSSITSIAVLIAYKTTLKSRHARIDLLRRPRPAPPSTAPIHLSSSRPHFYHKRTLSAPSPAPPNPKKDGSISKGPIPHSSPAPPLLHPHRRPARRTTRAPRLSPPRSTTGHHRLGTRQYGHAARAHMG
jgi:hypothetical protein